MARRVGRVGVVAGSVRLRRSSLLLGTALGATGALVFAPAWAQLAPNARPLGGQVVAGQASIAQNPAATTVNQASQRTAIEWQSFDVGSQHLVQFNQPNSSAVALNRVVGPDPSQIAGRIVANGNIILTNPSGVYFHQGAQVDANSLVVSAPGITNQNFLAGRMVFDQPAKPGAVVSNAGRITVKQAGLAALVAPGVVNSGTINARMGHVVLAGAEAATLDLYGDGLLSIDVTRQVRTAPRGADGTPLTALVTNTGTVLAEGGTVQITAQAADGLVQDLVRAGGTIAAPSLGGRTGQVAIAGIGGSVRIEGQVSADGSAAAPAGQVAVAASETVTVAAGARVSASGRGGGTVALGTTLARAQAGRTAALSRGAASPATPAGTAKRVVVAAGARVAADGLGGGSGGTVTALSTERSEIAGALSARGGPASGDGGVIEASSAGVLVLGTGPGIGLDAAAPAGKGGTIYLDPFDLVIGTGSPQASIGGGYTNPTVNASDPPSSGTSYIAPATLEGYAQDGAVTISLSASHNLTVAQPLNLAQGNGSTGAGASDGGPSLYLHAGNDLNVLANITMGSYDPNNNVPTLTLDAGHTLAIGPASGGTVTLTGSGDFSLTATGAVAGSSIVVNNGSVLTTSGTISLTSQNGVSIGDNVSISSGAGGVAVIAGTTITLGSNNMLMAASTGGGMQLLAGDSITIGGGSQLIGGSVTVSAGSSQPNSMMDGGPQPNLAGSITAQAGSSIGGGTGYVNLQTNSAGSITLQAGSTVGNDNAGVVISSGTGGTGIAGTVTSGDTGQGYVTLNSAGPVTEAPTGTVITSDLSGEAASFSLASSSNQISGIGSSGYFGDSLIADTGNVVVASNTPLTIGRTDSTGGGILVPNGSTITLIADTLTIGRGQVFRGENVSSGALQAPAGAVVIEPLSPGRAVELTSGAKSSGILSITRADLDNVVTDRLQIGSGTAGALTVGAANTPLDLTAPSTGGGTGFLQLDLLSGAAITQATGSTLTVPTLTASASTADLSAAANHIGTLGAVSTSGGFSLTNAGPLIVAGPIVDPSTVALTLTSGNLFFAGPANVGTLQLQTTGLVTQTAGVLTATLLTGRADVLSLRGANQIAQLGPFSVSGGNQGADAPDAFYLADARSLQLVGGVTAALGDVVLDTSANAAANVTVSTAQSTQGGDFVIYSGHDATVSATGSISAPNGNIYLEAAFGANSPAVDGAVILNGPVSGRDVFMGAGPGGINIAANVTASRYVALRGEGSTDPTQIDVVRGPIIQVSGVIDTPALSARGLSVQLDGANRIAAIGPGAENTGGSSSVATAGNFRVSSTLPLTVAEAITAQPGATIALSSDSINIASGGSLSVPGGTAAIAPYTSGAPLTVSNSTIPTSAITAATLQFGKASTGAITVEGTFALGNIGTLALVSSGAITEAQGASLSVGTLSGQAVSADLEGANQIGTLGTFTTTGAFTLANATPLTVAGTVSVGGGQTLTLATDSLSVAATGGLRAPGGTVAVAPYTPGQGFALNGSFPAGAITANTLQIGNAGTGAITVSGALNLTTVSALSLVSSGAVTETPGSAIAVGTLSGQAASADLEGANQIGALGTFTTTGAFTLANATPLTVAGTVSVGGGQTLTLLGDSVGIGAAGRLQAPNGTVVIAPYTTGGTLAVDGSFPSGAIQANTLQLGGANTGAITLSGALNLSSIGTLDLVSTGPITEASNASIQVAILTGSGGSANLGGANQITTLASFATTGSFNLANARPLSVGGAVSVGTGQTLSLASDNLQIGSTGSLAAPGGTVSIAPYTAGSTLSLSGFVPSGAIVANTLQVGNASTGSIGISGTFRLDGTNTLALVSAGSITEAADASLEVAQLTVQAASATLGGPNHIGTLGAVSTSGGFSLTNAGPLIVAGPIVDPSTVALTLTLGNLFFAGPANVGTLQLQTTGLVTQTAGVLTATLLTGRADVLSLRGANQIAQLGPFSVSGGNQGADAPDAFYLANARSLQLVGGVTAALGDVVLDTSANAAANVTVSTAQSTQGGDFVIYSGHDATVSATGSISAPNGNIYLEAAFGANSPAADGAVILNGPLSGRDVFMGAGPGGINIAANVTASRYVALRGEGSTDPTQIDVVRGPIIQVSGVIDTPALSARGLSVQLDGANRIAAIGPGAENTGGSSSVATAGNFRVSSTLPLTVAEAITAQPGATIALSSDSINIASGGSLSVPGGTAAIAPYTSGAPLSLSGFVPSGAITAETLQVGSPSTGAISLSGSFTLTNVGTLALISSGAVTEDPAATLQVGTLAVQADAASLTGSNRIATLGTVTTSTGFTLADTQSLAVAGPVSDGSAVALSVSGGDLALTGSLTAATVRLDVSGTVSEPGGSLSAGTLNLNAASADLSGSNAVGTLANTAVSGALTLNDGSSFSVAGPVQADSMSVSATGPIELTGTLSVAGNLALVAGGTLTQSGGTLTAAALTGSAVTSAQLGVGGSTTIGTLGAFTVATTGAGIVPFGGGGGTAALTLANAGALVVAGPLSAGSITLSASGALTLQSGLFNADTVNLRVAAGQNGATLAQTGTTNFVGNGTVSLALPDAGGSIVLNNLNAPGLGLVLDLGAGTASGGLSAKTLNVIGSSGGATLLGNVGGIGGAQAASVATISPQTNVAYTLNGCTIGLVTCGGISGNGGSGGDSGTNTSGGGGGGQGGGGSGNSAANSTGDGSTGDGSTGDGGTGLTLGGNTGSGNTAFYPLDGFLFSELGAALQTPKSFLGTTLGNILNPELFVADLITIGIVRDPADPELLLPNVSDRDY